MNRDRLLITGANGFVGKHLVHNFFNDGYSITALVHKLDPLFQLPVDQIPFDLSNKEEVHKVISTVRPNIVIHLAGNKSRDDCKFRFLYDYNLSISFNVIEACLKLPTLRKFVFLGSCDEYGISSQPFHETQKELPINNYGTSKLLITKLLYSLGNTRNFPSVVLRPSVIYGPNQGADMFIPSLIRSLLSGKDFPMTYGEQYRDFIYVEDVVESIKSTILTDNLMNGVVINIGSGQSYQVKNVALLLANIIDSNAFKLLKFGAVQYRSNESMNYAVNINRAYKLLGWFPRITLDDGLKRTLLNFKNSIRD